MNEDAVARVWPQHKKRGFVRRGELPLIAKVLYLHDALYSTKITYCLFICVSLMLLAINIISRLVLIINIGLKKKKKFC
jgi:hypothetical protein